MIAPLWERLLALARAKVARGANSDERSFEVALLVEAAAALKAARWSDVLVVELRAAWQGYQDAEEGKGLKAEQRLERAIAALEASRATPPSTPHDEHCEADQPALPVTGYTACGCADRATSPSEPPAPQEPQGRA